jgi:hypothetical protein
MFTYFHTYSHPSVPFPSIFFSFFIMQYNLDGSKIFRLCFDVFSIFRGSLQLRWPWRTKDGIDKIVI